MGTSRSRWLSFVGSIIVGSIALTVGVSMWGSFGKPVELASALNITDKKIFAHATVTAWQPDPDHAPMKYFAVLENDPAGFTCLADALEAQPSLGPLFSSPLTWKLPPGLIVDSWDDSYPDTNTKVVHATRGKWTVWAKLQGTRTFLVATK